MTSNYVPACREPCANTYEWVWYGYTWRGNCPHIRCNVKYTASWSSSVPKSLCYRLYTDDHVHNWCGSKHPSTLQLLVDTRSVLQWRLSPSASLSTKTWKYMRRIPCLFNPSTRWRWHWEEGNRLTRQELGGSKRQFWSHREKIILSPMPRIKPPFPDKPTIHFVTTLPKQVQYQGIKNFQEYFI